VVWKGGDSNGIPPVLLLIALIVTTVWALATLVAVIFPNHPVAPEVNAVMGATVTALFSLVGAVALRTANGKSKPKPPPRRRAPAVPPVLPTEKEDA
jgi:hypothetical protein